MESNALGPDRPLGTKKPGNWTNLGLGLSLAGMAVLSLVGFFGIRELEMGAHWVDHTFGVIQGFQKTQLGLKQAESDYAKFLLTHDEKYLLTLRKGLDQADRETQRLLQIAQGDALPLASLARLGGLVEEKATLLERGIQWSREGEWAKAVEELQSPGHKALDLEIQNTLQDLSKMESWSMKVHKTAQDTISRRNLEILAASALAALAVFLGAGWWVHRQTRKRRIADRFLKSSENKFQALAEATNEAFLTFDEKGVLVSMNGMN